LIDDSLLTDKRYSVISNLFVSIISKHLRLNAYRNTCPSFLSRNAHKILKHTYDPVYIIYRMSHATGISYTSNLINDKVRLIKNVKYIFNNNNNAAKFVI